MLLGFGGNGIFSSIRRSSNINSNILSNSYSNIFIIIQVLIGFRFGFRRVLIGFSFGFGWVFFGFFGLFRILFRSAALFAVFNSGGVSFFRSIDIGFHDDEQSLCNTAQLGNFSVKGVFANGSVNGCLIFGGKLLDRVEEAFIKYNTVFHL